MEQLHQLAALADEDEHVAITHVASHLLMHHTAEGTDTLTHVSPPRAQVVAHRVIQAEHGRKDSCLTIPEVRLPYRHQSGHEDHWGIKGWHQWVQNWKKQDLHVG